MRKITITNPVVLAKLKGDFKNKLQADEFTTITSYEKHLDQTYVVTEVESEEGLEEYKDYLKEYLKIKDDAILEIVFGQNGIDFITMC